MTASRILMIGALVCAASAATAEVAKVDLGAAELAETPLAGVSSVMVSGTMGEEGAFGALALMADGSVFPPHSHPDARMSVVVEGTMYLGVGDTVDPTAERAFEAGSVAITPAGETHWMAARGGDVRILEVGTGPTTTDWVQ